MIYWRGGKEMKGKRWKRVGALLLTLVMLFTCSINALATEDRQTEDMSSSGKIDITQYLDWEMPEQIVELLNLEETTSDIFGDYGRAYIGSGVQLDYMPYDESFSYPIIPISIQVANASVAYHGISCGSTIDEVNQVMKQQGWYISYYSDSNMSYMKETDNRLYSFDVQFCDEKVTNWYWINWVQGDYQEDFSDVPVGAWYFEAVKYVHRNWLMTGLNNYMFGPTDNLARAQFAVILHRMNNEPKVEYVPKFYDVIPGQWYTDAILWASNTGVVTGYSNGNYGPGDLINREQMALMMYRYATYKGYDTGGKTDFSKYPDASYVSDFAKEAMQWAVGNGIITGTNNGTRLNPQGNANRAECATIIMRFCEKYGMN